MVRRDGSRAADRAFVVIDGQREYLGSWGTTEAKARYHALLAEWHAGVREVPTVEADDGEQSDMVLAELVDLYLIHLDKRHEQGRLERPELYNPALDVLVEMYGPTLVADFAPKRLIAVQQAFIDRGWHKRTINERVNQIRRMFRGGIPREYTTAIQSHALEQVEAVETAVGESNPVKPVPIEDVKKVRPQLSRQVRAMVDLQLATGARPGEVCILRPVDLDMSDSKLWVYRPSRHKNERWGKDRVIYLGPKAQALIQPFLVDRRTTDFLFSPIEADRERRDAQHEARETPLHYGNRPGTNRKANPKRIPKDRYHTTSYARAIKRACVKAEVEEWSPTCLVSGSGDHTVRLWRTDVGRTDMVASDGSAARSDDGAGRHD